MTSHANCDGPPAASLAGSGDPEALVGRKIRRSTRSEPRQTPWAQIVMTVPSRDGLCWLVTYIDGDVDVWRVDDPDARYEFDAH